MLTSEPLGRCVLTVLLRVDGDIISESRPVSLDVVTDREALQAVALELARAVTAHLRPRVPV